MFCQGSNNLPDLLHAFQRSSKLKVPVSTPETAKKESLGKPTQLYALSRLDLKNILSPLNGAIRVGDWGTLVHKLLWLLMLRLPPFCWCCAGVFNGASPIPSQLSCYVVCDGAHKKRAQYKSPAPRPPRFNCAHRTGNQRGQSQQRSQRNKMKYI